MGGGRRADQRITVAASAGTCFGVDRALRLVYEAAERFPGRVCTLGPLIHNPRVVSELEGLGVTVVREPEEASGRVLVLRSHGVTPGEEERARTVCAEVIDAACPFVKRVHAAIEELAAEGRHVVVAGEPGHPEVRAACAHAEGALAAQDAEEARSLGLAGPVGIVAQTTLERRRLEEVAGALSAAGCDVVVRDTICSATAKRQEAAAALSRQVDVMVVVGGKGSANTRHLAEVCASSCMRTHHIEGAQELEASWFLPTDSVGVTAGASTPHGHIEEVVDALGSLLSDSHAS